MEIREIQNRKTIETISENKSCFFEKSNKAEEPLVRPRIKSSQITKMRNEWKDITINLMDIKRIIKRIL